MWGSIYGLVAEGHYFQQHFQRKTQRPVQQCSQWKQAEGYCTGTALV